MTMKVMLNADRFWEPASPGEESVAVTPLPNRRPRWPTKDLLGRPLTMHEKQILKRIAVGETYSAVALELGLTEKAVDKHAERIHRKLGAHCVAHLVHYALANGEVNFLFRPGESSLGQVAPTPSFGSSRQGDCFIPATTLDL